MNPLLIRTVLLVFYRDHVVAGEGDDSAAVTHMLSLRARNDAKLRVRAERLAIKLGQRHHCRVQVWDIR